VQILKKNVNLVKKVTATKILMNSKLKDCIKRERAKSSADQNKRNIQNNSRNKRNLQTQIQIISPLQMMIKRKFKVNKAIKM
jgi:hypothetical protein